MWQSHDLISGWWVSTSHCYSLSWALASKPGQRGHLLSESFSEVLKIKGTLIKTFSDVLETILFQRFFFFYFVASMFFPPTSFRKPHKTTLSVVNTIATLQVLPFWTDEGTMPVFRESCLRPLRCRVPQYWETLAEIIQLLGKFNLKLLELWTWTHSVFPLICGGERTERTFSKKLEEASW